MARLVKEGVNSISANTNTLSDERIQKILHELGYDSLSILGVIKDKIYREKGYYLKWDKEACLTLCNELMNLEEEKAQEVVQKALEVDYFNKEVFETHAILTSEEIQKKYRSASHHLKDYWQRPYWLLPKELEIKKKSNSHFICKCCQDKMGANPHQENSK